MIYPAHNISTWLWLSLACVLFSLVQPALVGELEMEANEARAGLLAWVQSFMGDTAAGDDCDCEHHATAAPEEQTPQEGDCPCPPGCDDCQCCPAAPAACLVVSLPLLERVSKGQRAYALPLSLHAETRLRVWRPPAS